jgi:hypothetical protein
VQLLLTLNVMASQATLQHNTRLHYGPTPNTQQHHSNPQQHFTMQHTSPHWTLHLLLQLLAAAADNNAGVAAAPAAAVAADVAASDVVASKPRLLLPSPLLWLPHSRTPALAAAVDADITGSPATDNRLYYSPTPLHHQHAKPHLTTQHTTTRLILQLR